MRKYTLREHFLELKSRFVKVILFYFAAVIVCYYFSDSIYNFLLNPLRESSEFSTRKIIYTGLAEAFITYIKLSMFSGIVLIMPVFSWHIYYFLAPGFYAKEKQIAMLSLIASPVLFWAGGLFLYYVILPKAWAFFLSFESTKTSIPLVLEAKISEYLGLIIQLILAFGLAFQMPIFMVILTLLQVVDHNSLIKRRRAAIVVNFIIAAIFTPPDVLSQFGLALPLLLLYEVSIILCKFIANRELNVRH